MHRRRLASLSRKGPLAGCIGPACRLWVKRYQLSLGVDRPTRLVIVSDLHFGWARGHIAFSEQVRRRALALGGDVILFLGDLAGGWDWVDRSDRVAAGAEALAGYGARLGCFAVLGNHEWADDPEARARGTGPNRAEALLAAQGWRMLENDACPLTDGLWLAGVASQRALGKERGLDDLNAALSNVPDEAPVILLAHEPDIFPDVPDRVRLTLSGHTHGGQFLIGGKPLYVPSRYGTRFAYGHHQRDAQHLIVSGGLGCSGLPFRLGVVPEIVVVDLT